MGQDRWPLSRARASPVTSRSPSRSAAPTASSPRCSNSRSARHWRAQRRCPRLSSEQKQQQQQQQPPPPQQQKQQQRALARQRQARSPRPLNPSVRPRTRTNSRHWSSSPPLCRDFKRPRPQARAERCARSSEMWSGPVEETARAGRREVSIDGFSVRKIFQELHGGYK